MSMNAPIILCSSKLASKMKKKTTSLRRRRNQKAEIDELASHFQSSTPLTAHQSVDATEQEGTSDNKTSAIDKLSVLRLTTAFLKFQNFLKDSESKLLNLALGVHVLRVHAALSILY